MARRTKRVTKAIREQEASEQSEQRPEPHTTGRRAKRSRTSSHPRGRLCRPTRGRPLGAGAQRLGGPTPVGTGFRRCDRGGRASEASNAPRRVRQAGKRSEAADQATREAGFAGRPGVAPRGQEREARLGGLNLLVERKRQKLFEGILRRHRREDFRGAVEFAFEAASLDLRQFLGHQRTHQISGDFAAVVEHALG